MRDLTIESLPTDERAIAERYVESFTGHLMAGNPTMNDLAANDAARDLITEVWIRMGPQADHAEVFKK